MKQTDRIKQYIEKHGSISSLEAFQQLGITRLAARVADMEADGIHFKRVSEETTNRYGDKVRYTRYSFAE